MSHVLAIDIGGTKMAVGAVDADGNLSRSRRVPTVADDGEVMWADLVAECEAVLGEMSAAGERPVGVGVGCGGPMAPHGATVSPLNIPGWRDFPLRDRLADQLGLAAFVDNDAKALALGEGWVGAAVGETDFLAMVVSTGVGGGIVLGGRLLDGAAGNAGHIGHVVVEPDGALMPGHARGSLEAEASGTAIARATGRPAAEAPPEVVERTGRLVGRAVGSVCNLLDLRLTLVSGSVALGFGRPFFDAAQRELDEICVLDFSAGAVIRPGGLEARGPLVGAGAVAWRGLGVDIGIS